MKELRFDQGSGKQHRLLLLVFITVHMICSAHLHSNFYLVVDYNDDIIKSLGM